MSETLPIDVGGIAARIQEETQRAIQRAVKGVGYFTSPAPAVGSTPKDLVRSRGPMRLFHYRPTESELYRVPILIVMATTNRGYILDLAPGQSFVEFLVRRGYDVFMLEWEAPRPEEKNLDLSDYALDFVPQAVADVQAATGETDLTVLGYCAGGMLSCIYSAVHPDRGLKNLVVFTTPVDFTKMELFANWADKRFFDVDRMVETFGNIPPEIIYTSFDMLRPAAKIAGQLRLWDNMWNDEFVKSYRMFDRWGADALALPGGYFRQVTRELLWENRLAKNELVVGGHKVDLGRITVPFLHVVAEHDHIVPRGATAPLIGLVGSPEKEEIVLKGGHVSIAAGANAVRRMWPAVDRFLARRSV
jgi:polyhydroxyalkanoate synthase subunit PhaC